MKRCLVLLSTIIVLVNLLVLDKSAIARERGGQGGGGQAQTQQAQQAQQAQEAQARAAQEQAFKAQRDQQEQAMHAQQEQAQQQHQAQEQALQNQEREARATQQQAMQTQREQARQIEQTQRQQAQLQQQENRIAQQPSRNRRNQVAMLPPGEGNPQQASLSTGMRPTQPSDLHAPTTQIEKAISMPVLGPNATPKQQEHMQEVAGNLRNHLQAIPMSSAPTNIMSTQRGELNNYFSNQRFNIGSQHFFVNRQNTLFNPAPQSAWPVWYQPAPGWAYCNGFTLGQVVQVGLDWLRWGWHPYYGPPPDGFVCASDYVPTPWVYIPAYGLWRQAGIMGYSPVGPGYDYTGPISVEILEPRQVQVSDPYTGDVAAEPVNTVYMYDAYYYPQMGRWGYMNHHGYFIWVNS